MRSLKDADHIIASLIDQILQLPSKLVADPATARVATHVSADEQTQTLEITSAALHSLALARSS